MLPAIEETSVLREPSFPSIASRTEWLCCTNSVHESAMIGGEPNEISGFAIDLRQFVCLIQLIKSNKNVL